ALEQLEHAKEDGFDPDRQGEAAFLSWLGVLEVAQPDLDDEDRCGPSFGHDLVGRWDYHTSLKNRGTIGSTTNACRVLAAVLRLWAMAKDQTLKLNITSEPTIKHTILLVSDYIETAFDGVGGSSPAAGTASLAAPRANDGGPRPPSASASRINDDEELQTQDLSVLAETQIIAGSSSAATKPSKARNQSATELKKGIVSETSLKKLKKPALMKLLQLASIPFDKSHKVSELLMIATQGLNNGTIKLTTEKYKCLNQDLVIPNAHTIKAAPRQKE
ncbi:hypothetical protein V8E36_009299, partial [Tilletia maclaganii]